MITTTEIHKRGIRSVRKESARPEDKFLNMEFKKGLVNPNSWENPTTYNLEEYSFNDPQKKNARFGKEEDEIWDYEKPMFGLDGELQGFEGEFKGFKRKPKITGLSRKSRKRLMWVESQFDWKSWLCLTYHLKFPDGLGGGKISKRHLIDLCQEFKKKNIVYFWVLEWQGRGVPHYHIWLDRELTPEEVLYFGKRWVKITIKYNDTKKAYDFHTGRLSNRIYGLWDVRVGVNYASKYASKSEQKGLPLNIESYGRWWGKSNDFETIPELQVIYDSEKPEDQITTKEMIKCNRDFHRCIRHWKKKGKKTYKRRKTGALRGFTFVLSPTRKAAIVRILEYHKGNIKKTLNQFGFL